MPNTSSGTSTFDKTFYIDEIMEEAYERLGVQDLILLKDKLSIISLEVQQMTHLIQTESKLQQYKQTLQFLVWMMF